MVEIFPPGGGKEMEADVINHSAGGIELLVNKGVADLLNVGDSVVLRIHNPDKTFSRQSSMSWASKEEGGFYCGFNFIDVTRFDPKDHELRISEIRIDPACALKIPASVALRRRVLPFAQMDNMIHVACEDKDNSATLDTVERLLKADVQFWEVDAIELKQILRRVYGDGLLTTPTGTQGGQDVAAVGDELLYAAYLRQASDIHIDPWPKSMVVRFRVDGKLELHSELPPGMQIELVSRFKVLAGMDIAERRAPQDGRFTFSPPGHSIQIDIRAATLPTKYGERMTLRLLALQTESLTLDRLGLESTCRHSIESFLRRSQGMMILTGPTGSGKTTTLYASIRLLLTERNLNVMTIEDPIEYAIEGVAQCEVDGADKVSFAKALRSILRHDPDVVMIGEIRDRETAEIAMKAALTGHLVLSTLHTNSSAATVSRLLDIGLEPYLVAGTLRLAISQRLSRKLCRHCRIPRGLTESEASLLNRPHLVGQTIYEPGGCIYCAGRGYSGRIGLYELLEMNAAWSREIAEGAGESRLQENMREAGVSFLEDDAIAKLFNGSISFGDTLQIVNSW
jgi:type IV pilus assembly protein PilB